MPHSDTPDLISLSAAQSDTRCSAPLIAFQMARMVPLVDPLALREDEPSHPLRISSRPSSIGVRRDHTSRHHR